MTKPTRQSEYYFGEPAAPPEGAVWPDWVVRKQDDLFANMRRRAADAGSRLSDELIDRLLEAGALACDESTRRELRCTLHGVLSLYFPWSPDAMALEHSVRSLTIAAEAEALAAKLEDYLDWPDMRLGNPAVELPDRLREFAQSICPDEKQLQWERKKRRAGRRKRLEDDELIRTLAGIYRKYGGRISRNGPFARFLKVVWEALPPDTRPASADAFVHHAKRMLPDLRAGGVNNGPVSG